jgi:hypothetical protein
MLNISMLAFLKSEENDGGGGVGGSCGEGGTLFLSFDHCAP